MNNLERDLLHYGEFITDDEYFVEDCLNANNFRIRLIKYDGYVYYHRMVDGVVVECRKVGKTL